MAKLARNNAYQRVSPADAWKVVEKYLDQGWTARAIASAAGIPRHGLSSALADFRARGIRRAFSPHHAAALMRCGDPTEGMVGALGSCRRLRGLARQGWDLGRVAAITGVGATTLAQIRVGSTTRVSAVTHVIIRDACDTIGMKVGDSDQAIAHATRAQWLGLMAWDDIDTDPDPTGCADPTDDIDEAVVERMLASGERVRTLTGAEAELICRRALARGMSTVAIRELYHLKVERYVRVTPDPEVAA